MADAPDQTPDVEGSVEEEHRRRHPRASIDFAVQLKFGSVRDFLSAHAEDISLSGIFLRSAEAVAGGQLGEVGRVVRLQFDAGSRRVVQGTGRVVRLMAPDAPGALPGVGIEFLELDAQSRALIAAIVEIKSAMPFGG